MTPILMGRWQTRLFLLGTFGALVTAIFYFTHDFGSGFWRVLFWVAAFGLAWDVLYIMLQQFKWDRDWPPVFQWAAGAWEGIFLYFFIRWIGLDIGVDDLNIPKGALNGDVLTDRFIPHYTAVFFVTWVWAQTLMRALFPMWKFHGGRIV